MNTIHWIAHLLALALWWGGEARDVDECAHGQAEGCVKAVEPLLEEDEGRGP